MRSFLTILGVVSGVSAVVTMVTLRNGTTRSVSQQIASLGSNPMVTPGQRQGPGSAGSVAPPFKQADTQAIEEPINGLKAVAPSAGQSVTVVAMAKNWSTTITGTTNGYFTAGHWTLASGRAFTEAEERSGAAVCVVGETVRNKWFGQANPVGSAIRVKQFSRDVIGLLKSKGQASIGRDGRHGDRSAEDAAAESHGESGHQLVDGRGQGRCLDRAHSGERRAVDAGAPPYRPGRRGQLQRARHERDRADDDRCDSDADDAAWLGAVAAVSLLVGGIGIMNIMLVSTTERTREIGTRLAIGALEGEVLLQFLVEAVTWSSLGGVIGIIIATAASIGLSRLMGVPFSFDTRINVIAFLFSAGIGVLFGYLPARRAAQLDPIQALRHE